MKEISEEGKKEVIIHSCVDERKIVRETKHWKRDCLRRSRKKCLV